MHDNFTKYQKELASALFPAMELVDIPEKSEKFDFSDKLYYLAEGEAIFYFKQKIFSSIMAPGFLGLHGLADTYFNNHRCFKPLPNALLYCLSLDKAREIIIKENLHPLVLYIISYTNMKIGEVTIQLKNNISYNLVKMGIEHYTRASSIMKENCSLSTFIIEATGVSRSRVMKIIQELKKGNYLIFENGKLVDIKKLPHGF